MVGDPEDVELGTQPLRGAPRASHDPLRVRPGCDQRQQPLADRLRRNRLDQALAAAARGGLRRDPLGLDLLGDLAQRDLAQRRQVLDLEEVAERRLDAFGRIDLALEQSLDRATQG